MNELNIAKTLVSRRKEKGITQDELASYMGVTKASVSKWETGQSYPDITFLPQLASYFNITVDELIDYKPQMTKDDIRKLYTRLATDFTKKPFDEVMNEVREIVKKYYSCFPLLFNMGAIILNHQNLAHGSIRNQLIHEAIDIFVRIKSESDDLTLCKQANLMEATCYFMLGEMVNVIDLLDNGNSPMLSESSLLASAYSMNGQLDKAREVSQISIYQNLLNILQNLLGLYRVEIENVEASNKIIERILAIIELFEMEKLHPSILFTIYLTAAQSYLMQNNIDQSLSMLKKYNDLATSDIYPLSLHGDSFFDRIDGWISELDLGSELPRNEKAIKESLVNSVKNNPAFSVLEDNFIYKSIIQKLSSVLGG